MAVVVTRLIGGLGNQMFQYATGRALALRLDVPLLLDTTGFASYALRRFELGELRIQAEVASQAQLRQFGIGATAPGRLGRALQRLRLKASPHVLREASFSFDSRILDARAPVYLDGYWQSERYFSDIGTRLREEFRPQGAADPANSDMLRRIAEAGSSAVSLHIRRGDYVSDARTAQYHGVCSLDYYRAAVRHVAQRVENPVFFVFSDDHAWVQEHFDVGHPLVLVQCNDADRGWWDMNLMRSCRHHIIANSSFSWWGAWLNPSADKIVVAPERWFASGGHDTRDLIPDSWVRL